ncbi:MAG: electron transfer flavoprotein subunit beta/FixA family protein [Bacteroidales bacterium]|jgi:electron transfer flavoprotein beta subunit|nr:electron transfer flavoprotein subunit beta/FixA family protein [Bacteroidales bacterium]
MNILVCISNVPDTTTKIRFTDNNTAFDTTGVQWIINPWDELALTRALELKEASGGNIEKITVINVGPQSTEPTIRKALAIGADDAVRIDAEAADAYSVASNLAAYLKENAYDIILCGIDSSDFNGSLVGGMLAEFLDMPSVSSVSKLDIDGGEIKLNREIDGGSEVLATEVPFVAVVQKGIALEPRIPSMRGIMMARKKPLNVVPGAGEAALTDFVSYEMPPAKAACKMVDAENVKELVDLLHNEAKVI